MMIKHYCLCLYGSRLQTRCLRIILRGSCCRGETETKLCVTACCRPPPLALVTALTQPEWEVLQDGVLSIPQRPAGEGASDQKEAIKGCQATSPSGQAMSHWGAGHSCIKGADTSNSNAGPWSASTVKRRPASSSTVGHKCCRQALDKQGWLLTMNCPFYHS